MIVRRCCAFCTLQVNSSAPITGPGHTTLNYTALQDKEVGRTRPPGSTAPTGAEGSWVPTVQGVQASPPTPPMAPLIIPEDVIVQAVRFLHDRQTDTHTHTHTHRAKPPYHDMKHIALPRAQSHAKGILILMRVCVCQHVTHIHITLLHTALAVKGKERVRRIVPMLRENCVLVFVCMCVTG